MQGTRVNPEVPSLTCLTTDWRTTLATQRVAIDRAFEESRLLHAHTAAVASLCGYHPPDGVIASEAASIRMEMLHLVRGSSPPVPNSHSTTLPRGTSVRPTDLSPRLEALGPNDPRFERFSRFQSPALPGRPALPNGVGIHPDAVLRALAEYEAAHPTEHRPDSDPDDPRYDGAHSVDLMPASSVAAVQRQRQRGAPVTATAATLRRDTIDAIAAIAGAQHEQEGCPSRAECAAAPRRVSYASSSAASPTSHARGLRPLIDAGTHGGVLPDSMRAQPPAKLQPLTAARGY